MALTDRFRTQHDDLLAIAGQIAPRLDAAELSKSATAVRDLLSQLMGALKMHLTMEDNSLYPRLLQHQDPEVRKLAKQFMTEMGGIAEVVQAYSAKWSTERKIQEDPETFITETEGLFEALAGRIDRENNQLYPLADA